MMALAPMRYSTKALAAAHWLQSHLLSLMDDGEGSRQPVDASDVEPRSFHGIAFDVLSVICFLPCSRVLCRAGGGVQVADGVKSVTRSDDERLLI